MATRFTNGSEHPHGLHREQTLFEEQYDLWWLTGSSLKRANALLGLRCMGPTAGFEPTTAFCYAKLLAEKGLRVDLRRGDKAYSLNNRFQARRRVMSRVLWLNPDVPLPGGYLERLARQLACGRYTGHQLVERLREPLSGGDTTALGEFGKLFVYQVGADLYEVEWELTTIPMDILGSARHRVRPT